MKGFSKLMACRGFGALLGLSVVLLSGALGGPVLAAPGGASLPGLPRITASPSSSRPAQAPRFFSPAPVEGAAWQQRTPAHAPQPRFGSAVAADQARGNTVLFGGYDGTTGYSDTWTWDGRDWTLHATAVHPSPRSYASAAFDPNSQKVILFGGTTVNYLASAETWAWDGTSWTQLTPATSPPARQASSLVYDPALGKLVLFGGANDGFSSDLADTWTFDGSTWTLVTTSTTPASRYGHQLAYDAESSRVILFGGDHCVGPCTSVPAHVTAVSGTYSFDGTNWTLLANTSEPSPRAQHLMTYDAATRQVVLFGGFHHDDVSGDTTLHDTWTWQGGNWHAQPAMPGPPGRGLSGFAYSPADGHIVLFGGWDGSFNPVTAFGDTWTFTPYSATSTTQYSLSNSDGATWWEMDAALRVTLTASQDGTVVAAGGADLWTETAGVNQDIAIFVSDNGAADTLLAWKESGGFAGTFSPNAALVQAVAPVTSGHTYGFKLKWKANKSAPGATIHAGAGPINNLFSPTRLVVDQLPGGSPVTNAVSAGQFTLSGSDGVAWQELDPPLQVTVQPVSDINAVVGANADLWTETAGFNQDLAIFVSHNSGADQLVAWKESGGYGGTFSPNAAFVQATWPMTGADTYVFKLKWKTNRPGNATIHAGAGPIQGLFSPTRLTVVNEPPTSSLSVVSTLQHTLSNNPAAWVEMDPALRLTVAPAGNVTAILGGNADLWTQDRGFNQDIAIFVSDNGGADELLGWKESGGFAGTYSPNAAFVAATRALAAGHSYVFKLKWKTNRPGQGATIRAGAGPLAGGGFSPTRLTAEIVA